MIAVAITAFSSIGCADPLVHLHTFGDINANASLAPNNPKQTPVFASLLPRSLRALNALIDLPQSYRAGIGGSWPLRTSKIAILT